MSFVCSSAADDLFGPQVRGCRGSFDFTLLFEQSIFGIVPSAVFILAFFGRCLVLRREKSKLSLSPDRLRSSRSLKQATGVIIASTQLALLVIWSVSASQRTQASIASNLLSFIANIAVLLLVSIEHTRSIRPSALLCIYLSFDILLNIPQCRTLWSRNAPGVAVVFIIGLILKAFMLLQESQGKRRILRAPYRFYPPEALGGIWNQITLWWLNPLFMKGSRSFLTHGALYNIDVDLSAENLETKFTRIWRTKLESLSKHSLLLTTFLCFKLSFVWLLIPRLLLIGFKFAQPLLILRVTSFLDKPESEENSTAYGLIGATGLIYLGLAITTSLYKHQLNRIITMVRGSLVITIYNKTVSVNPFVLNDSAALSLMSTDTETICNNMAFLDSILTSPIEIALGTFLMARQVGVACLAPVLISFSSTLLGLIIAARAGPLQRVWNQATQERVTFTASVLSSPKGIKMLGFTGVITKLLQTLRWDEMERSKGARLYVVWRNVVANLSQTFSPFFTFLIFVYAHGPSALNATEAFITLALIALITAPVQRLITALSQFGVGLGCFERIQAYLVLPECRSNSLDNCRCSNTGVDFSINSPTPIHMQPLETIALSDLTGGGAGERCCSVLRMEGETFAYPGSEHIVLPDINLTISPSSLTIIAGPVGSGKSTLLKAIISFCSQTHSSSRQSITSIAYCSQESWLPNTSFQSIVIGYSAMDQAWYRTVVRACDLEKDLATMPLSDQTVIGTRGTSLSGGQRQRLALARAIYARKSLLLLDDVLSGLDAATGQIVFDNILRCTRNGNLAVVLVTHNEGYLHQADNIIVLRKDGHFEYQGNFEQLCLQNPQNALKFKTMSSDSIADIRHAEHDQVLQEPREMSAQAATFEDAQQNLARKTGDISIYGYHGKSIGYQSLLKFVAILALQVFGTKFSDIWLQW